MVNEYTQNNKTIKLKVLMRAVSLQSPLKDTTEKEMDAKRALLILETQEKRRRGLPRPEVVLPTYMLPGPCCLLATIELTD
jgi:hypothetical protein